ncbi:RNA-directed DNA polymerase, eukaryota [Tanacetum coccineum]
MLFRLERDKDCVVMNRISNGQYEWNWSSSILGARNSTHLNNMLAEISQIEFSEDMDKCIWSLAHDGAFSVGSLRRVINDHTLPSLDTKTTWDKSLPRKVNIFMWRLKLDRLSHHLNLSSRGIEIPEISCSSCNDPPLNKNNSQSSHNKGDQSAPKDFYKESRENVNSKSYAHVVNAGPHQFHKKEDSWRLCLMKTYAKRRIIL